jgi:hypothetical protein
MPFGARKLVIARKAIPLWPACHASSSSGILVNCVPRLAGKEPPTMSLRGMRGVAYPPVCAGLSLDAVGSIGYN